MLDKGDIMDPMARRMMASVAAALLVAGGLLTTVAWQRAVSDLVTQTERQNVALTRLLGNVIWPRYHDFLKAVPMRDGSILRHRPEIAALHKEIAAHVAGLPVLKVKIYDLSGLTVYSSEPGQIGADKSGNAGFLTARQGETAASQLVRRDRFNSFEGARESVDLVATYVALRRGEGPVEGVFEIYTDVTPLVAQIEASTLRFALVAGVVLLGVFGTLALVIRKQAGTVEVRFDVARRGQEEIAVRNAGLEREVAERQKVEQALRDRTAQLELLNRIMVGAARARGVEDGLRICLAEVCTFLGWPIGHVYWPPRGQPDVLVSSDIWHPAASHSFPEFRAATAGLSFAKGQGLPGRVLASRTPAWIPEVAADTDFRRVRVATDLGIHAAFAFPVLVGSEVAMVVEAFSLETQPADETLMRTLTNLGLQMGYIVGRLRAEQDLALARDQLELRFAERSLDLAESQRRFHAIFDNMVNLVGILSPDGRLLDVNNAALRQLSVPKEEVLGRPFWETPWWTHDRQQQRRLREAVSRAATGELVRMMTQHPGPNGTPHRIDFTLTPVKDGRGGVSFLIPEGRQIPAEEADE